MIYDEKYDIPIFEDEDILDAVDYSEKLKNALVTRFDKDNNTINTINDNIDGISNMVISINRTKADANSVYTKKESDNKYANAIKQELTKAKEAQINSTGANLQNVEIFGESVQEAEPSIDNPSPITSIGAINYKTTGKNVFDGEMELGSINWINGEFEDNANCIRSKNYIEVIPGQYYAFSNSRNYTHNVYNYDKNKQFINAEAVSNNTSYQIPANAKYIRFRTTQGTIENNLDTDFQIEKGSTVTTFEPYKEKTTTITLPEGAELCSLPNGVEDCVDSTGVIHKKIGKMVLDGTGTYGFFPNYPGEGYCYYYEDARFKIKNVTGIDYKHSLCTHFTNVYSVWAYDTSKIGTYSDHPTLPRKYFVSDKSTLEEFKMQLAELQPTLIFELAEEETTQNLAETEKEKLQNIVTFEGINNIISNAPISAVYNTDTKSYIDSKFNTLAQQILNMVGGN